MVDSLPTVDEANNAINYGKRFTEGSCRNVYYIPGSKWVYKTDMHYAYSQGNAAEWAAYLDKKDSLPAGIKYPEMHMLENGVLAAEFIDGEVPSWGCWESEHDCEDVSKCFWLINFELISSVTRDGHPGNLRVMPNGDIYIIDLGHDS